MQGKCTLFCSTVMKTPPVKSNFGSLLRDEKQSGELIGRQAK